MTRLLLDGLIAAALATVFVVLQRRAFPCSGAEPDEPPVTEPATKTWPAGVVWDYDGEAVGV